MQGRALTTNQRARFLEHLAQTANVTASAEFGGAARRTFYDHREADKEFAAAWDEAFEVAVDAEEAEARRRAMQGVSRPLVSGGKVVKDDDGKTIMITEFSDTLMVLRLKAHRPKYRDKSSVEMSGPNGGPVATVTLNTTDPVEAAAAYRRLMNDT